MKRSVFPIVVLAFAAAANANLLSNGGFEANTYGGTSYQLVQPGDTTITDWAVGQTSVDIVGTDYSPYAGSFAVDLAGTPGPGSILQGLNLSAQPYIISFFARSTTSDVLNSTIQVDLGGFSSTVVANGTWQQYTLVATPGSGLQTFSLGTLNSNATNGNLFVDNVSIEAVPEPASMAVLGLGLAAFRRRRAAKK